MKIYKSFALVFLLITSLSCLSTHVHAQNKQIKVNRLNGNDLIKQLADQRNTFNKKHSNNSLPKAEYIINRNDLTLINFNGLDYYVKNNRVMGIEGVNLSDTVLSQITDKLVLLDSIQFNQSVRSNMEHLSPNIDFQKIRNIDRQFMLTLRMLSCTVRDIAALIKNSNPSLTVETQIAKMRLPNIDKAVEKLKMQPLVLLSK
ncbi:hypothetical protein ACFSR6_03055 [Pedobacter vanadiisoli]|uniref:Uncharacterized protein n=1 Tax=Pedobacter vanadiisoli TaxID=1761975 RepID=A0ABW5MGW1_9SPHI